MKRTLLFTALVLSAPALHAIELSFIRGPLENTGVDAGAKGYVRSQFKNNYSRMWADLRGLTPDAAYQLTVDGNVEADFLANAAGRANVQFRIDGSGNFHALDFDPRGKEVAITDATGAVLSMIYSGEGEPTALVVDERTTLTRSDTVASGRVEARYLDQKNKSRFILHLLGLNQDTYTLRVAGVDVATVDLTKGRSTRVVFEANKFGALNKGGANGKGRKNRHGLDFDPRGELVELVASDASVSFSGVMLAQIAALPVDTDEEYPLTSTGVDEDATGNAVVTTDEAGEQTLTITAQQLPVGDYELWIGGAQRGTLTVADDGAGGTQGQIIFATLTTGTEVELDFPLEGAIEIKQLDTVYLTGSLD